MSHVDEGALHAYLDGALDEYPVAEARRIRAHLECCGPCIGRLEEERSVRERASAVLSAADAPVVMPPLEELRRLARSGDSSAPVRARRRSRLGWAASVVLAVGAGWLLRSALPLTGGDGGSAAGVVASRSESSPTGGGGSAARHAREPVPVDATGASSRLAAAAVPSERTAAPATEGGVDEAGAVSREASDLVDSSGRPSGPLPAEASSRLARVAPADKGDTDAEALPPRELFAGGAPAPATPAPAPGDSVILADAGAGLPLGPPSGLAPGAPAGSAEPMAAGVAQAEASGAAGPATGPLRPDADPGADERSRQEAGRAALELRTSAAPPRTGLGSVGIDAARGSGEPDSDRRASDPGSLVVPGLDVVSIVWREEGVIPAGVRVLQRLDAERLLELIHLPERVDPASLERAGPGVTELVVPRENGWLVLRAPIDEAALADLLRRLEAAP